MNNILLTFKGIEFDITFYSSKDECYIEAITVNGGEELIDDFTEAFIADINKCLVEKLTKDAVRSREEDAGQAYLEKNYGQG